MASVPNSTIARKRKMRIALGAVLVAAALIGGFFGVRHAWPILFPVSPLVAKPGIALEGLQAKSLYFNPPAFPWLVQTRPDLINAEDKDPESSRSRAFRQAVQEPKLFRQLDRQYHFDAVLLLDDPSLSKKLIDHFLETGDFKLSYVDHWALVFRRDPPDEWNDAQLAAVQARLDQVRSSDRASALAKIARRLLAIKKPEVARRVLDEAQKLDGNSADVSAGFADYYLGLGRWNDALNFAEKALAENPEHVPALAAKLQALRATKHFIDALKISTKLNTLIPENAVRLWQHAETAREAREYMEQIKALERLIALADEAERRTSAYEFYLGEAYAHVALDDGRYAKNALEHLLKAVGDPLLSEEHRKFAEERITIIRERANLN